MEENAAPADMVNIIFVYKVFLHPQVQDVFHQQSVYEIISS